MERPGGQRTLGILTTSIYRAADIERIVADADLPVWEVEWDSRPVVTWRSVFEVAAGQRKVGPLLDTVVELFPALRVPLDEVRSPAAAMADPKLDDPAFRGFDSPSWKNFSPDGRAEAVIVAGQPTFVDISFLALGLERARGVCRLFTHFPAEGSGTAFRVGARHLLTNHHVLFDHDDRKVVSAQAWFRYETNERGSLRPMTQLDCDPDSIVGEKHEDWALIQTTAAIPDEFPVLPLTGARMPAVDDGMICCAPRMISADCGGFSTRRWLGGPRYTTRSRSSSAPSRWAREIRWTPTRCGSSG